MFTSFEWITLLFRPVCNTCVHRSVASVQLRLTSDCMQTAVASAIICEPTVRKMEMFRLCTQFQNVSIIHAQIVSFFYLIWLRIFLLVFTGQIAPWWLSNPLSMFWIQDLLHVMLQSEITNIYLFGINKQPYKSHQTHFLPLSHKMHIFPQSISNKREREREKKK